MVKGDRADDKIDRPVRKGDRLGASEVQLSAREVSAGGDHPFGWINAHKTRLRPPRARRPQEATATAADIEEGTWLTEPFRKLEGVTMDAIEVQPLPFRALVPLGPAIELGDVVIDRRLARRSLLPGHPTHPTLSGLRLDAVVQ